MSFEVGGEENVPGIPGACANRNLRILQEPHWSKPATGKDDHTQMIVQKIMRDSWNTLYLNLITLKCHT